MPRPLSTLVFVVLLAAAGVFVSVSGSDLPASVATHFSINGAADFYMSRNHYLALMIALVVVLPAALVWLQIAATARGSGNVKLPNREYWFAPSRRTASLTYVRQHAARFGCMLVLFLSFVHWLIVRANMQQPPQPSLAALLAGSAVFIVGTVIWVRVFYARFRKPPADIA